MLEKLDLKKRYKELYSAKAEPCLVEVPELHRIAVDGQGDPNDESVFGAALEVLYAAAYGLKFSLKKKRGLDWGVMPLEGDWWSTDLSTFSMDAKKDWFWTLSIVQPAEVAEAEVLEALDEVRRKKPGNSFAAGLRFEHKSAHEAAHILHLGPYEAEPPTIARLHAFIADQGLTMAGEHREIYLGDPRKSAPEKLKTIIRQPVAPK